MLKDTTASKTAKPVHCNYDANFVLSLNMQKKPKTALWHINYVSQNRIYETKRSY